MARKHPVAVGDRYARADTPRHVYTVTMLVDKPGHPPHARLQAEDSTSGDQVLVGVSALGDPTVWRRA